MTKIDPAKCLHKFVHLAERWYGQGKYTIFICKDCDAILTPVWKEWKLEDAQEKP